MNGPYRLADEREVVPENSIGVYWLSHSRRGPEKYVGSTPGGGTLRGRLRRHASEGRYSYFWFELAGTEQEALMRECEEYERLLPNVDNVIRPPYCRLKRHRHC